jgi:hypothetical protein
MATALQRRLGALTQHVAISSPAAASLPWPSMVPPAAAMEDKPRLAVISTVWSYFTHPEHMGDCFLHGWGMGGEWHD